MIRYLSLLVLLMVLHSCAQQDSNTATNDPNILFLFTDDQTFAAVRELGNQGIRTPNIDRLMQMGTTFTHAYNMGGWNGAICVASRSMIISGRYIWRARKMVEPWQKGDSLARSQTWAQLMKRKGYDTYMTGKWHVAAPADAIFDEALHIRPGMPRDANFFAGVQKWRKTGREAGLPLTDFMPPGYNRPLNEEDRTWSPTDTSFGGFWEGGKHWSEVVRDDALQFLGKARDSQNPFFMYVAFNAPHDPRQSPREYLDMYPVDEVALPESWLPEYPYKDSIGCSELLRDEALAPFPRTEYAVRVHLREYYAIITHLDAQIGLILDALEASGKMDNTYIFFTADHGLGVGRHGFIGKQNMYDHSVRVPLAFAGPGIPQGKKVEADVYLQDVMATSLELAGIPKPEYVDFHSLLPLARGSESASPYSEIYGCYIDLQRMIRKDNYKLIVYPKARAVRLYDMKNDPQEMLDLAGEPDYQGKVRELFGDLITLQEQMEDELDLQELYRDITN